LRLKTLNPVRKVNGIGIKFIFEIPACSRNIRVLF